jgi:hypothetical protein
MEDYKLRDLRASHTLGPGDWVMLHFHAEKKNSTFSSSSAKAGPSVTVTRTECTTEDRKFAPPHRSRFLKTTPHAPSLHRQIF